MLEKILSGEHGVVGLCVLLALGLIIRLIEFLWKIKEQKDKLSESSITDLTNAMKGNTIAIEHLDVRFQGLERTISDFPKLRNDMRRLYSAIKELAGDRWPKIRDEIMKDDFNL